MNRKNAAVAAAAGILAGMTAAVFPAEAKDSPWPDFSTPAAVPVLAESDLRAGDNAFAQQDYPVAVSFYTKYLEQAEKLQVRSAVRTAYERLLDALVMSKLPALAETRLNEYEKKFPGGDVTAIAMWRGDILFQTGKYQEAADLYRKLLPTLSSQDPRRFRTMFAYGQVLEKLGRWKEAAAQYEPLRQQASGTLLGRRAFVRLILCLAEERKFDPAWELLLRNPPADRESNAAYPLLAAYVTMKQTGVKAASGAWLVQIRSLPEGRNPLVYLTASAYGDAFLQAKEFAHALTSYRAAFHAAADKNEMFQTLNRMIAVVHGAGDKVYAARLAMSQLDLFKDSLLSPAIKIRTAKLLQESGNPDGALKLYESVFANMNSSDVEKRLAVYESALLQCRAGHVAEAEKIVHDHFSAGRKADGDFMLAEIFVRLKKPEEYIPRYHAIAERWPDRAARAYRKAAAACLENRLPDQVLVFLEKLEGLPGNGGKDVRSLYLKAAAMAQKDRKQEALQLYDEYLKHADRKDELVPQALYHSGLLAFALQDLKLASDRLSRFLKEYPRHALTPQAASWLIQIYAVQHDVISAERETWLLAERYPDSEYAVDAMFRLASHYAEEGSRDKATAALRKLSGDPRFPRIQARAIYELAYQAWRNGEGKAALQYLSGLYEKFSDTPVLAEAYYLQGDILRSDSDYKSAIPFYRKAIEMKPAPVLTAAAYGSIGDCLLAVAGQDPASSRNELMSAMQAYKTVRELPGCPAAFEAMAIYRTGRCLELLGKQPEASEQYRQVLYKFPASAAKQHPAETVWCVRAAEALTDIAGKFPVRSSLRHARFALHWLADAGMIPLAQAAERFEKLKTRQFNP